MLLYSTTGLDESTTAYLPYEKVVAGDSQTLLTIGGLTIGTWQAIIWILGGAVLLGVLIALVISYVYSEYVYRSGLLLPQVVW